MIKQRIKCTKKKAYIMFNDYAFFYNLLFSVFEARIFQESVAFNTWIQYSQEHNLSS